MNKLIVLSGVPGSGKSYFSNTLKKVKGSHVYVVSSDVLRAQITGAQSDLTQDELVWAFFYGFAKVYALDKEGIVILDATNYSSEKRISSCQELKPLFSEIDLVTFNIDPQVVSNQNLQREFPIPPEVLDRFIEIFEKPTEEDRNFFDKVITIENSDIAEAVEAITGDDAQLSLF